MMQWCIVLCAFACALGALPTPVQADGNWQILMDVAATLDGRPIHTRQQPTDNQGRPWTFPTKERCRQGIAVVMLDQMSRTVQLGTGAPYVARPVAGTTNQLHFTINGDERATALVTYSCFNIADVK